MSKKVFKATVLKQDAIVKIDISGAYYSRVYDLMMRILEKQPDIKEALVNINTPNKELSLSEAVIQTFMMLIKTVEEEANKDVEKYTETVEVNEKSTEDPS
jgi:hypothetical protein